MASSLKSFCEQIKSFQWKIKYEHRKMWVTSMEFASFNIVNNHFGAEHSKDSSVFLHNLKKKKTKNLIKKKKQEPQNGRFIVS